MRIVLAFAVVVISSVAISCSGSKTPSTNSLSGYGYSPETPILVGSGEGLTGAASLERKYLDRLRGPSGQAVSYERIGSCCPFETDYGFGGFGMLDQYEVRYPGMTDVVILYLNMYDPDTSLLRAPDGFVLDIDL